MDHRYGRLEYETRIQDLMNEFEHILNIFHINQNRSMKIKIRSTPDQRLHILLVDIISTFSFMIYSELMRSIPYSCISILMKAGAFSI